MRVFKAGEFKEKKSRELYPGDVVKIEQGEEVPADGFLIKVTNRRNCCFFETTNIDNQKNLVKKVMPHFEEGANEDDVIEFINLYVNNTVTCDSPSSDRYSFNGRLMTVGSSIKLSFGRSNLENFVPAGSFMRTATTAILVVVYTGQNCKIMRKNKRAKNKESRVDQYGKRYQKFMIFTTNLLCVFCALFQVISIFVMKNTFIGYLNFNDMNWATHFIFKIGNWQLLLAKMVPLNLMMTTRLIKYLQGITIRRALKIDKLEAAKNKQYISGVPVGDVYNPDSNEDLGMVDYVFIDKTGTLTSPKLAVSKTYVGTYCFEEKLVLKPEDDQREDEELRDYRLIEILKDRGNEGFKCREFLRTMAMVNNVEFEQDDQAAFKATSPDELAFAEYAKLYGAEISNSQDKFKTRTIEERFSSDFDEEDVYDDEEMIGGSACEYSILFQFDYTPESRCMSMLMAYQDEHGQDQICLFLKGAIDKLRPNIDLGKSPDFENIMIRMEDELDRGARVMFFCKRELDVDELYRIFSPYFPEMKRDRPEEGGSMRQKLRTGSSRGFANLKQSREIYGRRVNSEKKREELFNTMFHNFPEKKIEDLREDLEKELQFLGASICIEKFEPMVEHTLKFLRTADIKTWIMTGDNLETTLGLSKKLNLIGRGSAIRAVFKLDDVDEITEKNFVELNSRIERLKQGQKFGLAVTGEYFGKIHSYLNTNKLLYKQFSDILVRSEIAIFGEMVPTMKQQVIRMVRKANKDKVTLAIGDGVNDIPMLREAHVGVALFRANQYNLCKHSDYYLQKFCQLKLLLFYFGRGCYRKNTKLVLYMFFKNVLYVMTTFWAGTLNQFSATVLKPLLMENFFTLLLSALPMLMYGLFDKTFTKEQMLFNPLMYQTGKQRLYLNDRKFVKEFVMACVLSLYLTFNCLCLFDWGNYKGGFSYGWYNFGNMLTMGIVITVNLRVLLLANAFSLWTFLSVILSIGMYFGFWIRESLDISSNIYTSFGEITSTYQFYIYLVYLFAISVLEYLQIKMEYVQIDKKFIPDFDVQFDAMATGNDVELELLISGVSNRELDLKVNQNDKTGQSGAESEEDDWEDGYGK